jgi:hypothetical protein
VLSGDSGESLPERLSRYLWASVGLYALFLLPTALWAIHAGMGGFASARATIDAFADTWQAAWWHFPGLSGTASRILLDLLEVGVIAGLTWLFYRGFRLLNASPALPNPDEKRLTRLILRYGVVAVGLLVLVIPFHSSDLYGYLNRGFQQSALHTNPYTTPIADIPHWKQYPFLQDHWIYNPCPYGFFFARLAHGITSLASLPALNKVWSPLPPGGGGLGWGGAPETMAFFGAFTLFKLLNASLVIATARLIHRLAQAFGLARPWLALYLFLCNPLVLLHAVGNGHNDILMLFLLLGALWTLQAPSAGKPDRRISVRWAAWPLFALSVLTKYATIVAGPLLVVVFLRNRWWRDLGVGLALALLLTVFLGLPYVQPGHAWPWRDLLDNAGKSQHSIIDMLATISALPAGLVSGFSAGGDAFQTARKTALSLLKPLFLLGFAGFYLWQLRVLLRQPAERLLPGLAAACACALLALAVFAGAKFHPWYVIMFLPLALLLEETAFVRRFALTFGLFQTAGFTVLQNLPVINVLLLTVLPLFLVLRNRDPFRPFIHETPSGETPMTMLTSSRVSW